MSLRQLLIVLLVLAPISALAQTPRENYQAARAAEYLSDHETRSRDRENEIGQAFELIVKAAESDPQYVGAFAEIARKRMARSKERTYLANDVIKVGQKLGNVPAFRSVAAELQVDYKRMLFDLEFSPGKRFLQEAKGRVHHYCNVPGEAEQIYQLSRLAYSPASAEITSWGKYAAGLYMTVMHKCGGEGSDLEPLASKAFPIYAAIGDRAGMHKAGKVLGDTLMQDYLYGGYEEDPSGGYKMSGHRAFYDKAIKFYHDGSVSKDEIRKEIRRTLKEAEGNQNQPAADLARKTLTESF